MILASILITDEQMQDQPLAPMVLENIASFKRHHPDLEHRLFRTEETRSFIASEYDGNVLAAYDALKPYAFKCDLARLCIMLKHGGLYADLSVYFHASLKPQSAQLSVFRDFLSGIPWQTANTVFFAPPGHKAIAKGIELICENVHRRYYGKNFLCPTGPGCFGKAIALTCEPDELIVGDSALCREAPGYPARNHGFVLDRQLVAIKRKRGGATPLEIGISGGNGYIEMWHKRDIYTAEAQRPSA